MAGTNTFRTDVLTWFHNNTPIGRINRVVLVDCSTTPCSEKDSTTSLTYTFDWANRKLTISGTIIVQSNYTVHRLRLYSGTKLYYETNLPQARTVNSGDHFYFEWELTASTTVEAVSIFTSVDVDRISLRIINDLGGSTLHAYPAPTRVVYLDTTTSTTTDIFLQETTISKTIDTTTFKVIFAHGFIQLVPGASPTASYRLNEACFKVNATGATTYPSNAGSKNWCSNQADMTIRVFGGNRTITRDYYIRCEGEYKI